MVHHTMAGISDLHKALVDDCEMYLEPAEKPDER